MLHIIYGRIGSGKSKKIIEKISQAVEAGRHCILIVPDQTTFAAEQQLCTQLNIKGFIDIEVLSFNRLASQICDFCGNHNQVYLDERGKAMLLRAAVEACRSELTVYADVSVRRGFCQRLGRMLALLQSCNITPPMLKERLETLPQGLLRSKLADTALLYEHFSYLMNEGFTDSADMLRMATALTSQCTLLDNTEIFIDGFDMLTARLSDFVQALLIKAEKLTISLNHSLEQNDRELYSLQENVFIKMQKLAAEVEIPFTIEKVTRPFGIKSPEIVHLEEQLYSYPYKQYKEQCTNLHLYMARNREDEVMHAGELIFTMIKEQGMRYRDFCVLCNDMEGYSPIILRTFEDLGLPVFTDVKRPIASHPLVLFLLSALRACTHSFKPSDICDYISSSFTSLTKDQADWLLGFINQYGVQNWELERGLKPGRAEDEALRQFEELRLLLIQPLINLRKKLDAAANVKAQVYICYDFLQNQQLEEKLKDYISKLESFGLLDAADHSAQMWNITIELFEQMELLLGNAKLELAEFLSILSEGFASAPAAVIPSVIDCILLGDIARSKSQNVKVTFVLGLNDGILPSYGNSEEAVLSSKETDQLNAQGFGLTPDHTMLEQQHRFDIYSAFTRATKSLYISYAQSDSSGTAYKPSLLVSKLHKLFPPLHEEGGLLENLQAESLLTPRYSLLPLAEQINIVSTLPPMLQGLYAYMSSYDGCNKYIKLMHSAATPLPENIITTDLASRLFSSKNAISVTRLEEYAQCPYKHFIEYGLRPLQIEKYEANSIDTGILFHNIMENFSRSARAMGWENIDRDACYSIADKLFDEQLPLVHFGALLATARQKQINNQLRNIVRLSAWSVAEQIKRSKFQLLGEEITFGYDQYPPIEVQTPYGKLYLKGKIDRADIISLEDLTYVRIVDYKSSSHDFKIDKMQAGLELQLLTYMGAMLRALGEKSRPAGAFYFTLQEHEIKNVPQLCGIMLDEPWVYDAFDDGDSDAPLVKTSKKKTDRQFTNEDFISLLESTAQKTVELSTQMLKGDISASPLQETNNDKIIPCSYCSSSKICRYDSLLYKDNIRHLSVDFIPEESEDEEDA